MLISMTYVMRVVGILHREHDQINQNHDNNEGKALHKLIKTISRSRKLANGYFHERRNQLVERQVAGRVANSNCTSKEHASIALK